MKDSMDTNCCAKGFFSENKIISRSCLLKKIVLKLRKSIFLFSNQKTVKKSDRPPLLNNLREGPFFFNSFKFVLFPEICIFGAIKFPPE